MSTASNLSKIFRSTLALTLLLVSGLTPAVAHAKVSPLELTKRQAEGQIRNLIEPLLDRFCRDECKLLSITATVDLNVDDTLAPGFEDTDGTLAEKLVPSSGRIKLLIDDKVGPVSRQKLLELIQQYLDTLEFPVRIDSQITHFPLPIGSAGKVAELRERIAKQFKQQVEDLFSQFCPGQCLLADFNLQTENVNEEEAQYGRPGEFFQENGIALRIRELSGTILVDESLLPEERTNILEMARLKTASFRNVNLEEKVMKFPRPMVEAAGVLYDTNGIASGGRLRRGLASALSEKLDSKSSSQSSQNSSSDSKNNSLNKTNEQINSQQNTHSRTNSTQNSNNVNNETNQRQEHFERFEKIERVENGDAVQAELKRLAFFGLIFAVSILALLIMVAVAGFRRASIRETLSSMAPALGGARPTPETYENTAAIASPVEDHSVHDGAGDYGSAPRASRVAVRYEIERLLEELTAIYAQQPKVAKTVFSRILTEEGVEVTSQYIAMFGEAIVIDMLRDPSLQSDVTELMEYYAKNTLELKDEEKLELLKTLHNRTVAAKLWVMGSRSSTLFDFLSEMDGIQIMELVRNESLTVKAIVMTQCDPQKRAKIYSAIDEETRMRLLAELSRIDYLPRDYIFNVAHALKRKRKDNPKLNTEALPGSEVLITLLERSAQDVQVRVFKNLEASNPESARAVKAKLVSIETLRFLRDSQMLEVVLSLKHDELLQFLKGTTSFIRAAVLAKAPRELVLELEEELEAVQPPNREGYAVLERKIINRIKVMSNDGLVNLIETNERMFAESMGEFVPDASGGAGTVSLIVPPAAPIKKVAGW